MSIADNTAKIRAVLASGPTTRPDLVEKTGITMTAIRKSITTMTDRKEIVLQIRQRQETLISLNPGYIPRHESETALIKLAKQKGYIRSAAAAEALHQSKSAIEREMRRLAEAGEAIVCPVTYPDKPSELELRPAGYLPNNTTFRINYPDA